MQQPSDHWSYFGKFPRQSKLLVYCTRKITRIKRGNHKETKFCFSEKYTSGGYEKALGEFKFLYYGSFAKANDAYSNFIQKLMKIIEKVGPVKKKGTKRNSQAWLDSEVSEKLKIRGKLFKNLGFI